MKNMKIIILSISWLLFSKILNAQNNFQDSIDIKIYRAAATRINDLVHTKLDIKLDYDKSYAYGKAWITLKPHWYPTDSLSLDAKGMDIHRVGIIRNNIIKAVVFKYDGWILKINLDKQYTRNDPYTIFIEYTSKPNELKSKGSKAIRDAKGLYFINAKGADKDKPTQVWTQGESESNSAWFPTIDKPNQKSTEEIILTVPSKYLTLSNGKLISRKENGNGTRTDYWKMDLPHAPYLFFFGVGDYAVVKDHYRDKEVDYYVEKEYEPVARRIFGNTPEMMAFYSSILGVDYPWVKYAQMTAQEFVAGAMENTTATLHNSYLQQNARELSVGNRYENTIAHELFHQWFGDLVTAESWSNITLNESFARFAEIIWSNYKYGKDEGDATRSDQLKNYLSDSAYAKLDLVRFHYENREDVFDRVSYDKGGCILDMLRYYVGDSAFYKSLNLYLTRYKFKSASAQELRLAFEEVTGQDLNWYWNQWYYGSGHPKFSIDYQYDDAAGKANVIIRQTQNTSKVFRIPMAIDVYEGTAKTRYPVCIEHLVDTFTFSYKIKPSLINIDADNIILCEKQDNKTLDNYIFQYSHAGLYLDRLEAITICAQNQDDPKARELLKHALKDRYFGLRRFTLEHLDMKNDTVRLLVEPSLIDLARSDPNRRVKGYAIYLLGSYKNPVYKSIYVKAFEDSSYTVSGDALEALNFIDTAMALNLAKKIKNDPEKDWLLIERLIVLTEYGNEEDFDYITSQLKDILVTNSGSLFVIEPYIPYLDKVKDPIKVKDGLSVITGYQKDIPKAFLNELNTMINKELKDLAAKKEAEGLLEQANYIKTLY
jgi:aminopeptidase N